MDFLGFTLSVWAAIALGVFFLLLVFGCTEDRRGHEGTKWVVFLLGLVVFGAWFWQDWSFGALTTGAFWKGVGLYLGAGMLYSAMEFFFQVRREARDWARRWEEFKGRDMRDMQTLEHSTKPLSTYDQNKLEMTTEQRFVEWSGRSNDLVGVGLDERGKITPVVNKRELAEGIGCWTLFWPAYAVSLVLGDVLAEACHKIADLFALLSHQYVRRAFATVFKP